MSDYRTYQFTITLSGTGKTPEEAWNDAVEGFIMDPGPTPDETEYKVVDEGGDMHPLYVEWVKEDIWRKQWRK